MPEKISYCPELIRTYDRDRFALGLTAAPGRREGLWALFAFNFEVAKTRDVVSDPTLGLIRLQWWRDSIEKLYAGVVPAHEILGALAPVIQAYNLPQSLFEEIISAREFDLEGKPAEDLTALIEYAARTTAPLYDLALMIVGQAPEPAALRNISIAYALTGLLRAAPLRAQENKIMLPHGVSAREITEAASRYLTAAGNTSGFLKAAAALTRVYLGRLRRLHYDVKSPLLNAPPVLFALKALLGRFR